MKMEYNQGHQYRVNDSLPSTRKKQKKKKKEYFGHIIWTKAIEHYCPYLTTRKNKRKARANKCRTIEG